jgi:hypothetical protein
MDNPFKLIKPTDKPPENLKKDVMESIELMMLVVRMLQLFMVDYTISMPESLDKFFKSTKKHQPGKSGQEVNKGIPEK